MLKYIANPGGLHRELFNSHTVKEKMLLNHTVSIGKHIKHCEKHLWPDNCVHLFLLYSIYVPILYEALFALW